MAAVPGYVGSAGITWAASTTASVAGQSIGTAAWDRIVVVGVTIEETATINSCTIGGVTANVGISVRNTTGTPDNAVAFFWLPVATGTTATIAVTLSATSSLAGRISVWALTGAYPALFDSNSAQGAGATQTLTGVTIPPGGAGFWAFNNATAGTAITWTNATERDDTATATYRHGAADSTTAGTATITADGATTNQILAGISFDDAAAHYAWDMLPQNEKALFTSRKAAALALVASGLVMCPQPVTQVPGANNADTRTRQASDITTGRRGTRTLHYQSWVRPPAPPTAAPSNLTTSIEWLRPFDRAVPPRRPAKTVLTLPAYPYADVVAVTPSAGWFQPFRPVGGAAGPLPSLAKAGFITPPTPVAAVENRGGASVSTGLPSGRTLFYQSKIEPPPTPPAAAVVVATIEWIPPLSTMPPSRFVVRPQPQFVPPQVAQVTPDEWLTPFTRAVAQPRVATALYTPFVPKEVVAENTVTPDAWMQPFYKAAPATKLNVSNVTYPYFAPVATNARTEWDWYVQWKEPPRYWWQGRPFQPFIPREAVIDNTVTPDKWLTPFQKAVPYPPPRSTQPFYGYPYVSASNLTTTLEWMEDWRGPPRQLARLPGGTPFVPKETVQDVHGPEKWLQAFRGPPRYWPVKVQQTPFIPRTAVIDNTVTPDNWLFRFQGAVPRPLTRHTQPVFGYPYEAASNLTTSIEWLQKWQGPPRYTPLKSYPYQPFVPREAVIENTGTVATWLRGFDRATARRPAIATPLPWNYAPQVSVTFGGWHQPLGRATPRRPVPVAQLGWSYPPAVADNTVTIDKWQQRFSVAVSVPPVRRTQPDFVAQPIVVEARGGANIGWTFPLRRPTLFYQQWAGVVTPTGPAVYSQHIITGITVEFDRMLRYSCKAEAEDGAVEQAEQSDPWATATEQTVSFVDESEQADPWGTQDEVTDTSVEEEEEPGSGCP